MCFFSRSPATRVLLIGLDWKGSRDLYSVGEVNRSRPVTVLSLTYLTTDLAASRHPPSPPHRSVCLTSFSLHSLFQALLRLVMVILYLFYLFIYLITISSFKIFVCLSVCLSACISPLSLSFSILYLSAKNKVATPNTNKKDVTQANSNNRNTTQHNTKSHRIQPI